MFLLLLFVLAAVNDVIFVCVLVAPVAATIAAEGCTAPSCAFNFFCLPSLQVGQFFLLVSLNWVR